MRPQEVNNDNQ
ncbi:unnamed protein product, partial [Didymodactylos carnosus]